MGREGEQEIEGNGEGGRARDRIIKRKREGVIDWGGGGD